MQNDSTGGFDVQLRRQGSVGPVSASSSGLKQVLNILLLMPGVFAGLMAIGAYTPLNSRPLMGTLLGVFLFPVVLQMLSMVLRLSDGSGVLWRFLYRTSSIVLVLFALFLFANGGLDQSPPREAHVTVLGKSVFHGRRVTRYHLLVTSWRTATSTEGLDVSQSTFEQTAIGKSVSLELHDGLFGVRWRGHVSPD
jgi:hypothetical protein